MRLRISRVGCSLALVFWLGGGAGGDAYAQEKTPAGRQLLQETNSQEVLRGMTLLNRRPESLRKFEEELTKPLSNFKPDLQPDLPPPYSPRAVVIQSPRARNNWLTPAELMPKTDPGDWLNGMYGKKEQPQTSQEQFLQNLNRQDPAANPGNGADPLSSRRPGLNGSLSEDASLPSGIKEKAQTLRELMGRGSSTELTDPSSRKSLGDFFGASGTGINKRDEMRTHKEYMDTFRREVLGSTPAPPPTTANPLNPLSSLGTPAAAPSPGYGGGLDGFASTTPRRGMEGSLDIYNPALLDPGHDLNTALQQWNPLYSAPKPEPQRVSPPAATVLEAPKRRF